MEVMSVVYKIYIIIDQLKSFWKSVDINLDIQVLQMKIQRNEKHVI